jgi:hypothetical protein
MDVLAYCSGLLGNPESLEMAQLSAQVAHSTVLLLSLTLKRWAYVGWLLPGGLDGKQPLVCLLKSSDVKKLLLFLTNPRI